MDYMKIISLIDSARALERAVELEHAGVDELHMLYEAEPDLEIIKAVTRAVDVPLCVRISPERFEDVKKVLYAGAASVCLFTSKEEVRKEVLGRFGSEKVSCVVAAASEMDMETDMANAEEYGYGQIYLTAADWLGTDSGRMKECCRKHSLPVMLPIPDPVEDMEALGAYIRETGAGGIIISPEAGLRAMEMKQILKQMGIPVNTFASAIPFSAFQLNGDGLIPVVVQDYRTNVVLMLAYMNEEAYNKTIETGQMTYYSRSRQELWRKGETSGHYQYVKALSLDCDNDTILAKVEQVGAACHTGSYSCFFQDLVKKEYKDENPLTILKEDYAVIAERKRNPREGSYTNYLFDKGIDKILKKVGEEATEIVIAAKNPDAEELKYEISDFLYHVMVLMVERGLTWEDITRELAERR